MNKPALSVSSDRSKTRVELVGDVDRPKKKIRTSPTMDAINSLNESGIAAFKEGNSVEAESYYSQALFYSDVTFMCEAAQSCEPSMNSEHAVRVSERKLDRVKVVPILNEQCTVEKRASTVYMYVYHRYEYDEGMDVFQEPEPISDIYDAESISARLYYNIGLARIAAGDHKQAFDVFDKALDNMRIPWEAHQTMFIFQILNKLGFCQFRVGNTTEATTYYQRAFTLAIHASLDKITTAACFNALGVLHFHKHAGDARKAMLLFKQSLAIYREKLGSTSKEVGTVLNNIGRIHYLWSEYEKALKIYGEALKIRIEVLGEASIDVAATMYNTGQSYHQLGQLDLAMDYYQRFLNITTTRRGPLSRDAAVVYRGIADIHQERRELKLALKVFKDALRAGRAALGRFHPEVASTLNKLGNLCYEMKDYNSALKYYREGLEVENAVLEPEHPHIIITLTNIAHIEVSTVMIKG
jgi:tetratricopeptide (TPR) repeat protein